MHGGGVVTFYEHGDNFVIKDTNSNSQRVRAKINVCGVGVIHMNSGPNEGAVDVEVWNYDFLEGRKFDLWVREDGDIPVYGPVHLNF